MPTIKKADGSLVELKQTLKQPDLVLQSAPETEQLLANASTWIARAMTAMQRQSHGSSWTPDLGSTKQMKDLVDMSLTIEKYKQQVMQNDALALLSDEEMTEKLEALHAKKLGSGNE